jgi:dinuclear metal center YbgI/SA1388 family protein
MGLKIKDVTQYLESWAPRSYQESYDNAGLITGNPSIEVTGILVALDCTEAVVEEAVRERCNLIVAHHPIVFKGLKKLTGSNYVERTVIHAIRQDIAIYAIHTNLDSVLTGVNHQIAQKIGLQNIRILAPRKDTLTKLTTFIPPENVDQVMAAVHAAGAGQVGKYKNCSFRVEGTGTFQPDENANPHIGERGKQEFVKEVRVEMIFPSFLEDSVMAALRKSHPYEEVAYFLTSLLNENQEVGTGMIGELPKAVEPIEFLKRLKVSMDLNVIRYTNLLDRPIKKVALCGGSGSFLLTHAIKNGADVYI